MKINSLQTGFLAALTLSVFVLALLIFRPYLSIIFLALIISVVFYPICKKITLWADSRSAGAFLSVVIIIALVLIPVITISSLLIEESIDVYQDLYADSKGGIVETISHRIDSLVKEFFPSVNLFYDGVDIGKYISLGLEWFSSHFIILFSELFKGMFGFFLMVLTIFYFLKDGGGFVKYMAELSPMEEKYNKHIIDRLGLAINSVVRGNIIVGIAQGILTGIGFMLFGVPNPVIGGALASIASFIPSMGTGLVLLPGILYLFFIGATIPALGLLLWGLVFVGLVDNILGPMLMKKGVRIHPIMILFSVLGGLSLVGPIGFIFGPVVLSLLYALLEIYSDISTGEMGTVDDKSFC